MMMTRRGLLGALAVLSGLGGAARAAAGAVTVSVVYDLGGKMDKSFNQSGFQGVLAARRRLGATVHEYEVGVPADRPEVLRRAAAASGDVIVIGASAREAVADVAAAAQPGVRFTMIDAAIVAPNVASILFADHQAAFLAGVLAGHASGTGVAGFIGGAPVPPVLRFLSGFRQGLAHARVGARLVETMLAADAGAGVWDDPFRALLAARRQIDRGADVLFAVCGGSGVGVYQAAADARVLAVGVDSNQNHLFPGTMLTSAVKRVDKAVVHAVNAIGRGTWMPETRVLGLAEDAVGVAIDGHNGALVGDLLPVLEQTRRAIITGRIDIAAPLFPIR
ncbi:putative ABC-type transporter protein [Caenispirillum salinarum AK4]|uniref:Putative ABC-type transporter protein n=1 Tax=Caenispirillum salinarum AK4 TaxID=1238182 RepID=K9HQI7_9PROT|nr:BMP family ABC transporter substrate-binding protein [Caenispirillum salinarum]EKV32548.1 putative ABC-type transporter protein [Caenispirillum salinarum AK4]